MIVGGGMIARAMPDREDAVIYAAGVSDSGCSSESAFDRERVRLMLALRDPRPFVYFGTCSIYDEDAQESAYVSHKLAMEELVRERENSLICRLPTMGGRNGNPANLFSTIHRRLLRGEPIRIWTGATRNVLGVREVAQTVDWLLDRGARGVVNIASGAVHSLWRIVRTFEQAMDVTAELVSVPRGHPCTIPADRITLPARGDHLRRIVEDYYL